MGRRTDTHAFFVYTGKREQRLKSRLWSVCRRNSIAMKYIAKRFALVAICLMVSISGWSQGVIITAPSVGSYLQVGGIAYKVTSDDPKTVAVTYKYNSGQWLDLQQSYTGNVVIPESIIVTAGNNAWSYTVTGIDDNAFQYGSGMTALTIPNTVTSVSSSSFTNATGLTSLTINDGESNLSISLPNSPLTQLYVGRNITSYGAFKGATNISIYFGDGLTDLNNWFANSSSLNSISIHGSITTIGNRTFENCTSLNSFTVPASVTEIKTGAFNGCTNLKTFVIEDGDEELKLTDSFDNSAFSDNCALDSLYLGRNLTYATRKWTNLTKVAIGDRVTSLNQYLFCDCTKLTSVRFGKNIETVGTAAFSNCSSLESIDLSKSVLTDTPQNMFRGCSSLTSVKFPASITAIGNCTFEDCTSLNSFTVPASVTEIKSGAFNGCTNLKTFVIEDGDNALALGDGNNIPFSDNCALDSMYIGRNLTYLLGKLTNLTIITIGSRVNNLRKSLFSYSSKITRVYPLWEEPINIDNSVFLSSVYTNATLLVPGGTVKKYQITAAWNEFANIVPTAIGVKMTATAGGSIRLGDEVVSNDLKLLQVKPNSVLTFEITPEETHFLENVTINGEDVTTQVVNGRLTPNNLSEDLEIVATFTAKPYYTVTASASGGGTTVVGSGSVMWGNSTNVTLTPNEGYELKNVTVNGTDMTSGLVDGVLTLSNIQENKTVVATFQKLRYGITAAVSENGSISLSANEVEWDATATATFTPAEHYEVAAVSVNGEDRTAQLSNNQLTIANIRQATTVSATFRLQTFAVTETHNAGGSVSLSAGTAQWGSSITVTIVPDDEHLVKRVTVNNVDVTDDVFDNKHTVTMEGTTAITVTFEAKPYFSVTATSTAGGTATVGNGSVMWGCSTTVTLTPDECHELKNITVNGEDRTDEVVDDVLTLSDIRENTAVVATFGIITETITMVTSSGAPREMKGYSSDRGLDFTHVADVKAYIASFFTKEHTTYLTRIYVVPPHTGIVLKTDNPGVTVDVPTTNEDVYIANLLMPAVENVTIKPTETIDGVDYRNLMVGMLNGTSTMGFVEFSSQVVRSNNCYLRVPVSFYNSAASARSVGGLNMVFDDEVEATGIQAIEEYQNEENGNTYDLGGRKVNNSRKGLVIKNGKLIYVKP